MSAESSSLASIAIVGMAGRFPGARSVAEFWENQKAGREGISRFNDGELDIAAPPDSSYVKARGILLDVGDFDAAFFGVLPKEAELLDPQHRVFLECCWEAIEEAGYDPFSYVGQIGVFAGCSTSTYFLANVCSSREFLEAYTAGYQVGGYPAMMGSNVDFLATRVAYKLNLRGPAFTLQAGCSTSLLAVCQAAQSLLSFQSDMALAGGVSITFPQRRGYLYQEGGMVSPDGHCRTFDADAQGTVFGGGAGVVLLKRLDDAVSDGDHIYAVIKGFAVNNDGAAKVGYTAPGVEGQARVIAMAHAAAEVDPRTITYVEAHGTATPLGDPIEVAALTQAFRRRTNDSGFCALGTAKTNVGHLDIAAGVTGLIHAAQALRHKMLPPTLHFRRPNPKLGLENSPFWVNTELREWKAEAFPRRAGVSAFGVGGTNAHVVLEEAPEPETAASAMPAHLLPLSAKSEAALEMATANLAAHLKANPGLDLADVAHTLQQGRKHFEHRRVVVALDVNDAVQALESRDRRRILTRAAQPRKPAVAFLFPGQSSQYPHMAAQLYRNFPVFRKQVDDCAEILKSRIGFDLRDLLYPASDGPEMAARLTETGAAQPAIFTIEYALAKLWISLGIEPRAMIGHSVGEFVAACLAGVFSLEDALALVAARGRMTQDLPPGAMLSVRLAESDARALANDSLSLAASNGPALSVISGPIDAIEDLEKLLAGRRVACRRLATSHAFHSSMVDPVVGPFTERVKRITLNAPKIPYVSTVTGTWIAAEQATDPEYWGSHLRQPVLFSKAVAELLAAPDLILLEAGPGVALSTLARQHVKNPAGRVIVSSLPDASPVQSDLSTLLSAVGALWTAGVEPRWDGLYPQEKRLRVSLPTYPFERKRYFIEPPRATQAQTADKTPEGEMLPSQTTTPISNDRHTRIRASLAEIFEELSGMDLSNADPTATFLDMGFDSLFLTQATQAIQSKLGVKIAFRQLLDQESTLEALAAFVDSKLPPDALPAEPPAATPAPSAAPSLAPSPAPMAAPKPEMAPAERSAVERIVREQLDAMSQLMSRQLDMLRGSGSPNIPTAPAPVPQATAAPIPQMPAAPTPQAQSAPAFQPFGPYKPVQKGPAGGLTPQQEKYLAALIERYTRRTAKSKQATQEYRQVLADPRVVSGFRALWKEMVYPIMTIRSKGSRLWDVDGNEYIDILNGFGPTAFGHLPDFVTEAVRRQLDLGMEIGPQSPLAGKVAKMICELTGLERATFCNTGSEAVIAALRVARTVTGRDKVVLFSGSYHGMFDEVLVKGVRTKDGGHRSLPIAPGIPHQKVENLIVLDYGTDESLAYIREHAGELAAVLVEPVQSRHPALQPKEFVREIREITKASGAALIFDEVVTGFRVHPGGVQALWNIRADLATYGKVLGGGMPIGVLAGSAEYMDALDGGMWSYGDDSSPERGVTFFAGTFVRHPLALAACESVLHHLKDQGPELQQRLNARTEKLVQALNAAFEENSVPTRVDHFGSIFYFSFPADQRFGSLFYYHLREKGVHVQEGFPCFLTTQHSDADVEHIVRAFKETIQEMREGGALSVPATAYVTAAYINGLAASVAVLPVPGLAIPSAPREAPLTESQLEILLSAQFGSEASCSYNESISIHLRGDLNRPALCGALQDLLDRHEALRATFSLTSESQSFAPSVSLDVPVLDLAALDAPARDERVKETIAAEARLPFDLTQAPLVRVKLLQLDSQSHILLFTTHHIVCDGWSTNVILDELASLYNARHDGKPSGLSAPMAFSDYARAQAKHFEAAEGAELESYWTAQFREPAPLLDLPLDRPRPATKSYDGATCRRRIPAEIYRNIKKAGARQKCTLFVTLLAGFQTLLSRLSGQDDIVAGIPAAGQSLLEDQILVGHCVNFLPLRGRFTGNPALADYLAQVKRTLLDAYDHQNYTYGRLIRKLSIPRDPGRLPLMEVQFNLERIGSGTKFSGLEVEVDPNPKAFVNHDLFLNVVESEDGLFLDCDYNTRLFDESTIDRWLGHYETLLAGLAADATQPVSMLPLLSDAERREITADWNDTQAAYPRTACVHQLFEEQAARTPDAIAAVYEDRHLTYAELNRRADRLASHLSTLGVRPGAMVGVFVERSLDMIVALLGVLKSGAAYVPMDPTYPAERIAFVLEDANVPVLLTQSNLARQLAPSATRLVCLDTDWEAIERATGTAPGVISEDLAYVIYTSGSTGKPKGVEIPHCAVVNLLCSMSKKPGLDASDTLLAVTTLSFDIAALELFLPLCVGAKLVIASREAAADGGLLLAQLKTSRATLIQATPVTFRLLIEAGWTEPRCKVLCGGEALPRDLANQLLERAASLWNMYGPTETTIWSSTVQIQPGDGPVPVGPPIGNTQFYVLDAHGQLAPIGVAGELYIGGDGLARGYFHRPELTAERFIRDPFSADPAARLYRTGDSVRRLPTGAIEFLGRLDNQVKLRGFRIELGEIETALGRYPGVREAVVMLREDAPGDKRLVAYVTTAQQALTVTAVREFLTGKLPNYMLPSAVVRVDAMPLTPNGKIDPRALPPPEITHGAREKEFVAPRTDQEKALARIWADVLRVDRVGIQDNLFELGADSIHIFRITARATEAGFKFTPVQLLQYPRVSTLIDALSREEATGAGVDARPIQRVSRAARAIKAK